MLQVLVIVEVLLESQELCGMLPPSRDDSDDSTEPCRLHRSMTREGRDLACRPGAPSLVDLTGCLSQLVHACTAPGSERERGASREVEDVGLGRRWRGVMARVFASATACMAAIAAHQAAVLGSGWACEGEEGGHLPRRQTRASVLNAQAVVDLVHLSVEDMLGGLEVGGVERAVGGARVLSALAPCGLARVPESGDGGLTRVEAFRRLVNLVAALGAGIAVDDGAGARMHAIGSGRLNEDSLRALLKPLRLLAKRDGCCLHQVSRSLGGWGSWEAVIRAVLTLRREGASGWGLVSDVVDLALALPPGACGEDPAAGEGAIPTVGRHRALGKEVARYGICLFWKPLCRGAYEVGFRVLSLGFRSVRSGRDA